MLPIFLTWVGGLICYLVLKDRNPKTATSMLILGVVMVAVEVVAWIVVAAILFFVLSQAHAVASGSFA